MIFLMIGLNNYVVYIDFYLLVDQVMEEDRHGPLICRPCILKTERHNFVGKSTPRGSEGSLLTIFYGHLNLVVAREPEGHHLMSSIVNEHVNVG